MFRSKNSHLNVYFSGVNNMRIVSSLGYQQFGAKQEVDVLVCKDDPNIPPPPPPEDPICGAPDPLPTDPTKDNGACGMFDWH